MAKIDGQIAFLERQLQEALRMGNRSLANQTAKLLDDLKRDWDAVQMRQVQDTQIHHWLTSKATWQSTVKDIMGGAPPVKQPELPKWRQLLQQIPNLKGQLIGGHTIVWSHSVRFTKSKNPILSKWGDQISENPEMRVDCSCGWFLKDVLPLVTKLVNAQYLPNAYNPNTGGMGVQRAPSMEIDFALLEEVILNHLPQPLKVEEIEYISFTQEWLEDSPEGFLIHFLETILQSGGILHMDIDTRSYFLVDDQMTDSGIEEIKEMLAGYEVGTRKVRVIRG